MCPRDPCCVGTLFVVLAASMATGNAYDAFQDVAWEHTPPEYRFDPVSFTFSGADRAPSGTPIVLDNNDALLVDATAATLRVLARRLAHDALPPAAANCSLARLALAGAVADVRAALAIAAEAENNNDYDDALLHDCCAGR